MKQMMSLIKNDRKEPGDKKQPDEEKKKKREERRQRFNDTPICKHCGKKHPTKKEDECWELEANKASRPTNWKSSKST
jgi:hypothetical protein